jgi:hypothetical protein
LQHLFFQQLTNRIAGRAATGTSYHDNVEVVVVVVAAAGGQLRDSTPLKVW